jgi:RNA polymerase sigma-70 factor (ECF subfamily)
MDLEARAICGGGRIVTVAMMTPDVRREMIELLPRLRRFAMVLTRSSDASDDLVQASVARALERHSQWRPESRLDRWMFQIMKTVWLNNRKSAEIRRTEPLEDHEINCSVSGTAAVESKMTLREVRLAFTRLPIEQQQALMLVSVEGYGYREAAELLDVPIGTVISRVARGRVALAEKTARSDDRVSLLRRKGG